MLVGTAVNLTHNLRYSPWSSSLRCFVLLEDIVVSVMWNSERSLHALDHQEYLDLEAMALCVMTAYWTMELELSLTRYAMYLVNRIIAGMYVGYIPSSALTPMIGVVECNE